MNEVLIYGYIYDYSAQEFVRSFSEVEGDSLVCRINTNGGEPEAGWSMLAKLMEFQGTKLVKIDGKGYSMGAFAPCYADDAECLDVSQFLIHRASYGLWYEGEYMTDPQRVNLLNINKKLRQAFEAKIDVAKFENLKVCKDNGITVDRIFSMDERVDVFLTADEAKKIGLVKRIVQLTPEKAKAINSGVAKIVASSNDTDSLFVKLPKPEVATETEVTDPKKVNKVNMTIEELKAQHPGLYASVFDLGVKDGAKQHEQLVAGWMAWSEVDPEKVKTGIESGVAISMKDISEFNLSAMKTGYLEKLKAEAEKTGVDGTDGTETIEEIATPDANKKQIDDLTASIIGKTNKPA